MQVQEGTVEIEAPDARDGAAEGRGEGVFYNPVQELNRDLTIAVLRAYRDRSGATSYLDGTAASGIRGVRAAADGWDVTLCDRDPEAVALCRENLAHNGLEGTVVHRNANALMHESRFDIVDIDPFGTPIPFADAAFRSARRLLCVTATDTAPLCGAHAASGIRKYGAVARNTDFHAEMGVRVLLSALVRTAVRYDVAARPILSHATRHYVRAYLELSGSATEANDAIDELGYVHWCPACLRREAEPGLIAHPPDACPGCGQDPWTAGPIYLGPTCERAFVTAAREALADDITTTKQARKLLGVLEAELDTPTHYDHHRLCRQWGRSASAMDEVLDRLREAGFEASRSHYGGTTFKTDAGIEDIEAATDPNRSV